MCKKTKQTFIISIITAILSLGACLFLLFQIQAQGLSLENNVNVLNENTDKEIAYTNINKKIKETEKERQDIVDIFLHDEDEGLDFVNEIEILAPSLGLSLETKGLGSLENEEGGVEAVIISFVYSGKKSSVIAFSKLMETIPYHSSVESLSLKKLNTDDFEGQITMFVTIQSL